MARVLSALIWLIALGCADRASGPFRVRLVDRLVEGAGVVEPSVPDGPEVAGTVVSGTLGDLAERSGAVHRGPFIEPLLAEDGEEREFADTELAVASVMLREAGDYLVRVRPVGERSATDFWFAVDSEGAWAREDLRDPERLAERIRGHRPFLRAFEPDGGTLALRLSSAGPRALLLLGATRDGSAREAEVRVEELSARGAFALGAEAIGHPAARRVSVAGATIESIVVPVPGEARVTLDVPRAAPVLRASVAALYAARQGVAVEIAADGVDRVESRRIRGAAANRWEPVELDLTPIAGETRTITLRTASVGGGDGAGALVAFGAPVVEATGEGSWTREPRELDVVWISLDTVRADRTSLYGAGVPTTPNLERIASESAVFEAAIAPAPWTLPSHASMFSGRYPDRHGAHGPVSRISADTPLLAEALRARGYETTAFTGGGYVNPEFGFARGFERYGIVDPAWPPEGLAAGDVQNARAVAAMSRRAREELLDALRADPPAPRFVFVHTYAAHNYMAPEADLAAVSSGEDELQDVLRHPSDPREIGAGYAAAPDEAARSRWRRRAEIRYDASLRVADRLVGDVVAAIERSGRLDRTLLVVSSDHGEELLERGAVGHGQSVYEEQIRVPLLVRGPGVAPARIPDVVSLVDLVPTLGELLGLDPLDADGKSFAARLGDGALEPRAVLARGNRRDRVFRALRGARRKLVAGDLDDGTRRVELFDLEEDARELVDLSGSRPDEARALEDALAALVRALHRRRSEASSGVLSPAVAARLRELGYLGGE